jgi:hypothetical protein
MVNRLLVTFCRKCRQDVNRLLAFTSIRRGFAAGRTAELFKEALPSLHAFRASDSYRQELLGVPAKDYMRYDRESGGLCLCHSNFRQQVYREKYQTASPL